MTNEKAFCRIPIKLIVKFTDNFPHDVYLKLSDTKIVKISHQNEPIKNAIVRYHKVKGVQDIYVTKKDYLKILTDLKEKFKDKLFSPYITEKERMELLDKSYAMIKDSMISIGMSEPVIELSKKISQSCVRILNESRNIFGLLKKFRGSCDEGFIRCIVIGYFCSGIMDNFDWKTESIKEKCALAAILCDILLTAPQAKDIEIKSATLPLTVDTKNKITSHVKNTITALSVEKWISKESLTMIEQHHEEQDGSGLPYGVNHTNITQLSAIFIVSLRFTELLFQKSFDFKIKDEMLAQIRSKYNQGVFKKAIISLNALLEKN